MGLPPPARDYSSLEIHVFTAQNINTFTPLVSVHTLHCTTAPCRESSQRYFWIPQDQSSWECLQAENIFAFSSAFLDCFCKCLKHKIAGKSKQFKELWGGNIFIQMRGTKIFCLPFLEKQHVPVVGYGWWEHEEPGSCHQLSLSQEICFAWCLSAGPWRGWCGTCGRSETLKG